MVFSTRIACVMLVFLVVPACSLQEVQKFAYNTGSAISCRHANDNLPDEALLDYECLENQGERTTHEEYIEIRNE